MKPTDSTRICDKCKVKVAKHVCIACEEDICVDCVNILTFELQTKKFNAHPSPKYYSPGVGYNERVLIKMNYAICKKCDSAIGKPDTKDVIQTSEEMKKLMEKIKKTVLASRMATALEDSELKKGEGEDLPVRTVGDYDIMNRWVTKDKYSPPKGIFSWFGKKAKKRKDDNPFL